MARIRRLFELPVGTKRMPGDPQTSPLWPADSPAVTTHITVLQGIITRLADNSASCKTWCLTLLGALVSLAGATHVPGVVTFAIVPILVFGFVDTMYLAQEKSYRDLYGRITRSIRESSYGLDEAYEASATIGLGQVFWALSSWSILPIYGGLILTYIVVQWTGWAAVLGESIKSL